MLIATSWDDGLESDRRLLELLEKYQVRASFALSSQRYQQVRIPNDIRDPEKYGWLMPASELGLYRPHDICSHTTKHREQTLLSEAEVYSDLHQSKTQLAELFQQEIAGIVWPYGCSSNTTRKIAEWIGYLYGRTTPNPLTLPWNLDFWDVVPLSWRTELSTLIDLAFPYVVLSGHTYELRREVDWEYLERFYRDASQDSRCRLVTMTELMQLIQGKKGHESGSRI
jgi:peptidoglycan/xylan/chitin deacetylase (PgdA/CDA1 family)